MNVTPALLRAATGCTQERAVIFADAMDAGCIAYEINTPLRLAHFFAQVGHESVSLAHVREIWGPTPAQQRYEGRADLGNTQPGDGERFMGRGLLQTTGRANYESLRDRLRARGMDAPDFVAAPQLLEQPQWAVLSACDYWDMRRINALADASDFVAVTKAVNGGTNGIDDRRRRLERAVSALGLTDTPQAPEPAAPAPAPEEKSVVAPALAVAGGFLWELAKTAIKAFTPLAAEKLTKELDRHTDKPEVSAQIVAGVIEAVKTATGKSDPMDAVVALKTAPPETIAKAEEASLAHIDKLMPVLAQLHTWDKEAWSDEEASRDAADARAKLAETDQDPFLTRSIIALLVGLLVALLVLIAVMVYLKADAGITGTLIGLFAAAGGAVTAKFGTRYDHRYGSSRGSAAKDVLNAELARRPRAQ